MNHLIKLVILCLLPLISFAQNKHFNLEDGLVAEGYDVVDYFDNKSVKGSSKYSTTFIGLKLNFSNEQNLKKFKSNPQKFLPQYGGYCAYAMAKTGEKVSVNPKTFEIRDGKLFLFYNAFFNNTLESWREEGAERLNTQADENWKKILKND